MNQLSSSSNKESSSNSLSFQNNFFSSLFNLPQLTYHPKNIEISPKKSEKNSPKKNLIFPEQDFSELCKKLDFSEVSENTMSNYSISDNESMEINELSNEDLTEMKNISDFSSLSSSSLTKIKPKKKFKNFFSDKSLTFIHKKQNFKDSLSSKISKFEEEYAILKTLCRGEMGTVYLCLRLKDQKKFAVKKSRFFSRKFDYENMLKFEKDIEDYNEEPGKEFIIKYLDFWLEEKEKAFPEKKNYYNKEIYIVTNYYTKGNLKEFLSQLRLNHSKELTYSFFWDVIFQMIVPINYLHKLGYIHSDIKPTNYLIMDNNQLILNDFCLSLKEKDIKTNELEGDSVYISPELFYKNIGVISHKSDIFSLIILINDDYTQRDKFIDLITNMTKINNNERPELCNILNDINNYPELYSRFEKLKNKIYEKDILINNLDICKFNIDESQKENSHNDFDNINKIFFKRSNSMENLS